MVDRDFPKFWLLLWKLRFYHWQQNCQLFSLKWQTYFVHFWEERLPNAWTAIVCQFPFHSKSKWCSLKKSLQLGCMTSFCICPEFGCFLYCLSHQGSLGGSEHAPPSGGAQGFKRGGAESRCLSVWRAVQKHSGEASIRCWFKEKNPPITVDSIHQTLCKWTLFPSAQWPWRENAAVSDNRTARMLRSRLIWSCCKLWVALTPQVVSGCPVLKLDCFPRLLPLARWCYKYCLSSLRTGDSLFCPVGYSLQ